MSFEEVRAVSVERRLRWVGGCKLEGVGGCKLEGGRGWKAVDMYAGLKVVDMFAPLRVAHSASLCDVYEVGGWRLGHLQRVQRVERERRVVQRERSPPHALNLRHPMP